MDEVIPAIEKTIFALLKKDFLLAQQLVFHIDRNNLAKERSTAFSTVMMKTGKYLKPAGNFKRIAVKEEDKIHTFKRDHFICRYCERFTINPLVLREISRILPDVFPYHLHWKFEQTHLLYWIYTSSIEHKISFPNRGNSDADNLITSCYLCNDIKSHYPLDLLGWELLSPSTYEWDGFTKYLLPLQQIQTTSLSNKSPLSKDNLPILLNVTSIDLKSLPIGTIARNIQTQNYYVVINKTEEGISYYSQNENMILKIKSKILLVNIEFKPAENYSSIKNISKENYSIEHLKVINRAMEKLL